VIVTLGVTVAVGVTEGVGVCVKVGVILTVGVIEGVAVILTVGVTVLVGGGLNIIITDILLYLFDFNQNPDLYYRYMIGMLIPTM
jgi:hypothetical protein